MIIASGVRLIAASTAFMATTVGTLMGDSKTSGTGNVEWTALSPTLNRSTGNLPRFLLTSLKSSWRALLKHWKYCAGETTTRVRSGRKCGGASSRAAESYQIWPGDGGLHGQGLCCCHENHHTQEGRQTIQATPQKACIVRRVRRRLQY
ncbi:hypothetical protein K438DRAFT_1802099 [Mycena galopus ATCC 62051]|nr:hypothetical protein K438DRAFT_1802099 [Mycena galopus ATCC 62051]